MPSLLRLYLNKKFQYRHMRLPTGEEGFSLVEVLAAVTLYVFLLGSVFSLYSFGVNTYRVGTNRVDLQQNIRLAADFITRELRYAYTLQLINEGEIRYKNPDAAPTFTIKQKNGEIVQLINNTEQKVAYNVKSLIFDWDDQAKILYFSIKGIHEGNTFSVRSAVCLQNLRERW